MSENGDLAKSDSPEKPGAKTKGLSRIALVSIILGVTELLMLWFNPTVALVLGILAVISYILAARRMHKGMGRLRRWSAILIGGLLPPISLTVSAYWSIDAPAIPNDYTVADLRATAPEYDSSYEILCRLNCEDDMALHLKWQIHDDLLQIVVNRRLGIPYSLKARAYGDAYVIDPDRQVIFSPGPDGKDDTEDDIKVMVKGQDPGSKQIPPSSG